LRSNSKRYLRGITYRRTPFFGMIAVALFVIRAEAVVRTVPTVCYPTCSTLQC